MSASKRRKVVARSAAPTIVEPPAAMPVVWGSRSQRAWMIGVAIVLSLFILGTYANVYSPRDGWTKMDGFGEGFAARALPRLRKSPHATMSGEGLDGQFYAQMAIDPSLQDPAFDQALDNPAYRGRRIGLSAISFGLGWGKPRRVIQAYALSNLLFWFVLLGTLVVMFRPWTGKQVLCCAVGLVSFGSLTSMEWSFVDLPTTAMIFVGLALAGWSRYGAFAAATLTRETGWLAAVGCLDVRRPFTVATWARNVGWLTVATVPFAAWMLYVSYRFDGLHSAAGVGNFAPPFLAIGERLLASLRYCASAGLDGSAKAAGSFGWLYLDHEVHEVLTVVGLCSQALYLALRRDLSSAIWRTGICYAALCCVLGPAVWGWTGAAARVLLPLTLCFYLQVAKERDGWFWPFFVLSSLSVPFGVHEFWLFA